MTNLWNSSEAKKAVKLEYTFLLKKTARKSRRLNKIKDERVGKSSSRQNDP